MTALRLRARKDSVGVMRRSTMRLSQALRRRLRADDRKEELEGPKRRRRG